MPSRLSRVVLSTAALAALACTSTLTASAQAAQTVPAAASDQSGHCTFVPHLPGRIAVGRVSNPFTATLTVSGPSDCAKDIDVAFSLKHGKGDVFVSFDNKTRDTESVSDYAFTPGTYPSSGATCEAGTLSDTLTCSVTAVSTVIKFTGHTRLSAARSGRTVSFTASASRYRPANNRTTSIAITDKVAIQRLVGKTWRTIHTATAGTKGYRWTYRNGAAAHYRAVSSDTSVSFGAISAVVIK